MTNGQTRREFVRQLGISAAAIPFIDGREILLHQGFAQFAAFTGRLPPKAAMRTAVEKR